MSICIMFQTLGELLMTFWEKDVVWTETRLFTNLFTFLNVFFLKGTITQIVVKELIAGTQEANHMTTIESTPKSLLAKIPKHMAKLGPIEMKIGTTVWNTSFMLIPLIMVAFYFLITLLLLLVSTFNYTVIRYLPE